MLLSKSAYARHMGVSRQTVYGWIARGEIVLSGDKVDVEATQAKQNSAGAGAGAGAGAAAAPTSSTSTSYEVPFTVILYFFILIFSF